jgi:superfamily I DNA/RNA helicase
VTGHPSVVARLERLAPDQRTAATAPPGPLLCIAPAGSGKTTTLVARIAWLIDGGVDPATIAAITFNARAAEELRTRLTEAVAPLGVEGGTIRVRTFHALGREILADAGASVEPLVDRLTILRRVAPAADPADWRRLDDAISRLKLDLGVTAEQVAADPAAGPVARTFVAYEAAVAATGGLDFDDLVVRSLRLLETSSSVLECWRDRCAQLLVDEVQDVDRSQLRLALLLAAPANRIFLVGDDDQSIYGWRLAEVNRDV